jgi:leukotriene-A4 hydrolase
VPPPSADNSVILAAWLEQCIQNRYAKAWPKLDEFLTTVGRRKFLTLLYRALIATEEGRKQALEIYGHARANHHSVSVRTLDGLLGWTPEA